MRLQTPDETRAIKGIMASRRALWRSDGRAAAQFPKFHPGMTTADYIAAFSSLRAGRFYSGAYRFVPVEYLHADRAAPFYCGPEVTAEYAENDDDGSALMLLAA